MRGRNIAVPSHDLRPTSSKARQAFFNIVGPAIVDASFLDLFAGSGIFSFEAVSRGASRACAVDSSPRSCASIREEARRLAAPVEVVQRDVLQGLRHVSGKFDVVYADPPYAWEHYDELLEAIAHLPLNEGATVGIEHRSTLEPAGEIAPPNLTHRKTARYGTVAISIYDRADRQAESLNVASIPDEKEGIDVIDPQ